MHQTLIRLAALTALASTVAACGGRSDSAAGDVACEGSAGGHLSLTERADMVYTVSFREDGDGGDAATIEAVIVARGAAGWKSTERSRTTAPAPAAADSASLSTSADLGGVRVGYDRSSNVAWVHNERVVLDSFNVVLVDRIDGVGGEPTVAQRVRITPAIALAPGECGARTNPTTMVWADSIRARLMRNSTVRAFATP